jgi:hypothetical protein
VNAGLKFDVDQKCYIIQSANGLDNGETWYRLKGKEEWVFGGNITLSVVTLTSISIKTPPTKTAYTVGDALNTAGLTLTASYSDGSTKAVASGFTVSPTALNAAGTKNITVTFEGKTATFAVTVNEIPKEEPPEEPPVTPPEPETPDDGRVSTEGKLNGIVLSAIVTEVGVKFDWVDSRGVNALGYRIYRSTTPGGAGLTISDFPIKGKEYVDVNVNPETRYYYTIARVEKEASFNQTTVELTPEVVGARSEELAAYTAVIVTDVEKNRSFIMMTIGNDTMIVKDGTKEIDPGRGTTPVIVNGRTMVPIRAIVEEMGGAVGWDEVARKITLDVGEYSVEMWLGSKEIAVNGVRGEMDIAPTVTNERTVLPVRFAAENVGCQIEWIDSLRQIIIVFYEAESAPTA